MQLFIIHQHKRPAPDIGEGMLRFAFSNDPIARLILEGLSKSYQLNGNNNVRIAIPERWASAPAAHSPTIERYRNGIPLLPDRPRLTRQKPWLVISNGRFATQINSERAGQIP